MPAKEQPHPHRKWLRGRITEAWKRTIEQAYCKQLINSEAGLQVHFCHHLMTIIAKRRLRLFVEPTVRFDDRVRVPDVLICTTKEVIGIIELKFKPKNRPSLGSVRKDVESLLKAAADSDTISIVNSRYLGGPTREKERTVAQDALVCWAGIYRAGRSRVALDLGEHGDRLLELHALTSEGNPPTAG